MDKMSLVFLAVCMLTWGLLIGGISWFASSMVPLTVIGTLLGGLLGILFWNVVEHS